MKYFQMLLDWSLNYPLVYLLMAPIPIILLPGSDSHFISSKQALLLLAGLSLLTFNNLRTE